MKTVSQLREHLESLKGRYVLWPGIPGPQCMAVFASVNTFLGGPAYAAPGAKDLWNNPALASFYEQIPASAAPRYADIPIWGSTWGDGFGHVAVNLEDLGPIIYALGQNPGPAIPQTLSKTGLLGYLRPRNLTLDKEITMEPSKIAEALLEHKIIVDGKEARLLDHFVNLCSDTRAIKNKTDKLK